MKNLVVCINNDGWEDDEQINPVYGGIYEVTGIHDSIKGNAKKYYSLKGFWCQYLTSAFRPTDNTFGEVVESIVSKQVELEVVERELEKIQ